MEMNLLDRMLSSYVAAQTNVTFVLQNKIRVTGKINSFDSYIIIVDGQKREIVYRHAVSTVSTTNTAEAPVTHASDKQAAAAKPAIRPFKPAPAKPGTARSQPPLPASAVELSINTGMKEGLLKWMQEQKAAK